MFNPKLCIEFTKFAVRFFRKVMFGSVNDEFLSKLFNNGIHCVMWKYNFCTPLRYGTCTKDNGNHGWRDVPNEERVGVCENMQRTQADTHSITRTVKTESATCTSYCRPFSAYRTTHFGYSRPLGTSPTQYLKFLCAIVPRCTNHMSSSYPYVWVNSRQ